MLFVPTIAKLSKVLKKKFNLSIYLDEVLCLCVRNHWILGIVILNNQIHSLKLTLVPNKWCFFFFLIGKSPSPRGFIFRDLQMFVFREGPYQRWPRHTFWSAQARRMVPWMRRICCAWADVTPKQEMTNILKLLILYLIWSKYVLLNKWAGLKCDMKSKIFSPPGGIWGLNLTLIWFGTHDLEGRYALRVCHFWKVQWDPWWWYCQTSDTCCWSFYIEQTANQLVGY